jgi:pimeloyl-ACP methyl ester carboxylesterase
VSAPTEPAVPAAAGLGERRRLRDDPQQAYWLHVPAAARRADAPLLVCVHGISRNAGAHLRAFAPWAERHGCVLLAPHFARTRFPDYQRLGRPGRLGAGGRADLMLWRIVDAVRAELGLDARPVHLFGHSGGAQFVLRLALTQPQRVAAYVASAAGAYVWPDAARAFPAGCAPSPRFADLRPTLAGFAALPGLVVVGARDDARTAALRQGARVDAEQGRTRRERAERYVAAVHAAAPGARLGLQLLPGCGHGFGAMVADGGLAQRAAQFLFGAAPAPSAGGV